MGVGEFRNGRFADLLRAEFRSVSPAPLQEYKLIGVRWYGAGCYIHETAKGDVLTATELRRIRANDIVYNKMWASKGSFALVPSELDGSFGTNEYPTFVARGDNHPAFLGLLVTRPSLWHRAKDWSVGSTGRVRLNPKDFLQLPISYPPPEVQRGICAVVTNLDELIAVQEALLEQLITSTSAILGQILTQGVRKSALVPLTERWVVGRVAEGVTHMPKGWRLVRLTKVAKLESGHTPDRKRPEYWDGDIPWISLQDAEGLEDLEISQTAETIGQKGVDNSSARRLPKNTVVFLRTGSIGKCSIMGREMTTSQHFANWVCGSDLDPRYLLQVFRHMQREWQRLKAGSVLPDIYMPTFKKLQILLPPLKEQRAIADIGESFDRRIRAEKAYLAELRAFKDGLAQELLSGRLRLPEAMIARFGGTPALQGAAE